MAKPKCANARMRAWALVIRSSFVIDQSLPMPLRHLAFHLLAGLICAAPLLAAPVAAPRFSPEGGALPAPLKVTIRCATPDASVHVTLDGSEPTLRDLEIDADSSVLLDEPGTLKAKAWLPDGSASATTTATYALRPVEGNGASFSDQTAPALMTVGRSYPISVTLRNIGRLPWSRGTHAIAPYRAKDGPQWGVIPIEVNEIIATWSTASFETRVTAPPEPGTYNLRFRMLAGGRAFGEATPILRVTVLSAADYERETKSSSASLATTGTGGAKGEAARPAPTPAPLSKSAAAALAQAKSTLRPAAAADLDRLVRELQRSARSFRYLRTIGFNQSDAELERLITEHPALFKAVRIIRRDEQGQRVIPGWPGLALQGAR